VADSMTLEAWRVEMLDDMGKFVAYWERMNKHFPEQFPMELLAGDWDEQFRIHDPACDSVESFQRFLDGKT